MIIEIALGVALGLFIFVNWRGLLALSSLVTLVLLLLVVAGVACWALYSGLQVVRGLPPLVQPGSLASAIFGVGFGLLMNVLLAFAVGTVIEQRFHLAQKEAFALGAALYVLFLVSVVSAPIAILAYVDTKAVLGPLLLLVLLAAWVLVMQQFVRRARSARRGVAA